MGALLVTAAAVIATTAVQAQSGRRYFTARTGADTTNPPFSGAVLAGNTLYLSGEIGTDANRRVPETADAEAKAVLDKVQARLREAGMSMDDLVQVQIFSPRLDLWPHFNTAYIKRFSRDLPARAYIGSGPLLMEGRFEMMGMPLKPPPASSLNSASISSVSSSAS